MLEHKPLKSLANIISLEITYVWNSTFYLSDRRNKSFG